MKTSIKFAVAVIAALVLGAAAYSAKASAVENTVATTVREDPATVSVTLKSVGPNKVKVIKIVRTYLDLDLRAAKDLVDAAENSPVVLAESLPADKAAKMKAELEEVGAKVVIK